MLINDEEDVIQDKRLNNFQCLAVFEYYSAIFQAFNNSKSSS